MRVFLLALGFITAVAVVVAQGQAIINPGAGGIVFPPIIDNHGAGTGGACTGTINLSTGCVQPMLGGL